MPDEPEASGLLALMLLHDSRRAARFSDGELVLLADQDRSLWDGQQVGAGRAALQRALALRGRTGVGAYTLQATIASLHAEDARDWTQIAALYDELARLAPSPVIELNRAVALAEAQGPAVGLASIEALDGLEGYHYFHAARAELLRRLDRWAEARAASSRRSSSFAPSPSDDFCRADSPRSSQAAWGVVGVTQCRRARVLLQSGHRPLLHGRLQDTRGARTRWPAGSDEAQAALGPVDGGMCST